MSITRSGCAIALCASILLAGCGPGEQELGLRAELEALKAERDGLDEELGQSRAALQSVERQASELSEAMADAGRQAEELKLERDALTQRLGEAESEAHGLAASVAGQEKRVLALASENERAIADKQALQLHYLKKERESMESGIAMRAAASARAAQYEQQLMEMQQALEAGSERLAALQRHYLDKQRESMESEIALRATATEQQETFEERLAQLERGRDTQAERLQELQRHYLDKQRESMESEIALRAAATERQAAFEQRLAELEQARDTQAERLLGLQLHYLDRQRESMNSEIALRAAATEQQDAFEQRLAELERARDTQAERLLGLQLHYLDKQREFMQSGIAMRSDAAERHALFEERSAEMAGERETHARQVLDLQLRYLEKERKLAEAEASLRESTLALEAARQAGPRSAVASRPVGATGARSHSLLPTPPSTAALERRIDLLEQEIDSARRERGGFLLLLERYKKEIGRMQVWMDEWKRRDAVDAEAEQLKRERDMQQLRISELESGYRSLERALFEARAALGATRDRLSQERWWHRSERENVRAALIEVVRRSSNLQARADALESWLGWTANSQYPAAGGVAMAGTYRQPVFPGNTRILAGARPGPGLNYGAAEWRYPGVRGQPQSTERQPAVPAFAAAALSPPVWQGDYAPVPGGPQAEPLPWPGNNAPGRVRPRQSSLSGVSVARW